MRFSPFLALLIPLVSCAAAPAGPTVHRWGALRDVMRDGRTEGRVALDDVVGPRTVAVGAVEGLAGEITVDGGAIHVAEVAGGAGVARAPRAGERATLLVAADVEAWSEHALGAAADFDALEAAVRALALERGFDASEPFPFRVEGRAPEARLHVVDGSCPIANPGGPAPWRWSGADVAVVLVGFFADGSAGVLTHHGRASHVHALVPGERVSGHLDAVALEPGARLFLPAR